MNTVTKNFNNNSSKPRTYLPSGFFISEALPSPKRHQEVKFHQHMHNTAIKQQHIQELFSNSHRGEQNKIKVLKTMTKVWLRRQAALLIPREPSVALKTLHSLLEPSQLHPAKETCSGKELFLASFFCHK